MTILWKHTELNYWSVLPEETEQDNNKVCIEFGCGIHLTPAEQLYGDRCLKHSKDRKKKMTEIIEIGSGSQPTDIV